VYLSRNLSAELSATPTVTATEAMTTQTITQQPQQPESERRDRGERKTRAAGGPEDSALYRCSCGHQFAGNVSTHVACPRCGTDQDW
jgi:hypothetical protein